MIIAALVLAASPYDVQLAVDLPLTGFAGAVILVTELTRDQLVVHGCDCRPETVNALDRLAIGPYDRRVGLSSDILVAALIAVPLAVSAIDATSFSDWLSDAVVLVEALALNVALNQIVKVAVQRPRPLVYAAPDPNAAAQGDDKVSFYSSHASTAFAVMNALALTFAWRHPGSSWRAPVWILANLAAATIASLRVAAHKHFVSDVLVGGAIGAAIGLLVPFAHKRRVDVSISPLAAGAHVGVGYSW